MKTVINKLLSWLSVEPRFKRCCSIIQTIIFTGTFLIYLVVPSFFQIITIYVACFAVTLFSIYFSKIYTPGKLASTNFLISVIPFLFSLFYIDVSDFNMTPMIVVIFILGTFFSPLWLLTLPTQEFKRNNKNAYNSVVEIKVDGKSSFEKSDTFRRDARINISTLFKDRKEIVKAISELNPDSNRVTLPLSLNKMVGRHYKQILHSLTNAGFERIVVYWNCDIKDEINPYNNKIGEVQEVTINGAIDYDKGYSYDKNALIRIVYHTYYDPDLESVIQKNNKNTVGISALLNAEDYIGQDYSFTKIAFKNAGFTNIILEPLEDLNDEDNRTGNTAKVLINGNSLFTYTTYFPEDAEVVIKYHSLKTIPIDMASDVLVGKDYETVIRYLKNKGFYNIDYTQVHRYYGLKEATKMIIKDSMTQFCNQFETDMDSTPWSIIAAAIMSVAVVYYLSPK